MQDALLYALEQDVRRDALVGDRLNAVRQDVLHGRVSPFRAARELLALFNAGPNGARLPPKPGFRLSPGLRNGYTLALPPNPLRIGHAFPAPVSRAPRSRA